MQVQAALNNCCPDRRRCGAGRNSARALAQMRGRRQRAKVRRRRRRTTTAKPSRLGADEALAGEGDDDDADLDRALVELMAAQVCSAAHSTAHSAAQAQARAHGPVQQQCLIQKKHGMDALNEEARGSAEERAGHRLSTLSWQTRSPFAKK